MLLFVIPTYWLHLLSSLLRPTFSKAVSQTSEINSGISPIFHFAFCVPNRLHYPWSFSRQEYWNELPCPPSGDLPNPGIEPRSPTLQGDYLPFCPWGVPRQEYWSGLPCLPSGYLPNIARSPTLQADYLPAELPGKPLFTVEA